MDKTVNILEIINRPSDTYEPNPNDAYKVATTNTTPKYDVDFEKDYSPGTALGPIPNIQSQTEVYSMPNQDIFIFYAKDNVIEPRDSFVSKVKAWFSANIGPATGPNKDKNILGFLKLGQFEDGYKVKGIGLDPSIQGQGKAIKLYVAFSAWRNLPIYSDYTQTPSAKRMWQSLIGRYPTKVVAYDQQTKKNIPLDQAGDTYHDYVPTTPKHPASYSKQSQFQLANTNSNTLLLKFLPDSNVNENVVTEGITSKMDKEQADARDIVQAEIDAGKLTTVAEIKEYIIQLRLAGVIRYKEDALALFKHFTIPYRGTVPEDGGAGSGAGAGTGGGGGAGNGSGGGASGGADGGGGTAGTGSGFVAADTMGMGTLSTYSKPKKKKKKKKTKVKFGASVYEGNDGNCYEASGKEFMELARAGNKTAKLVHADITPRLGGQQGNTYGHAWIEDGAKVNDVSDNHGSNINKITNGDKIIYYGIADPTNIKKYDYKTFAEMVRKHKHWGPWSSVERLSPFDEGDVIDFPEPPPYQKQPDPEGEELDYLRHLASRWYHGDEDPNAEKELAEYGWEIGQVEAGEDDDGVFIIRPRDINGDSYISFTQRELLTGPVRERAFDEGYFKNLDIDRQERGSDVVSQRSKNPMKSPDKRNWGKLVWLKNLTLSGSYSNADLKVMGFYMKDGEWVIQEPTYNKIKNQLR